MGQIKPRKEGRVISGNMEGKRKMSRDAEVVWNEADNKWHIRRLLPEWSVYHNDEKVATFNSKQEAEMYVAEQKEKEK